jgi:DNA-binding response OmpR family regulator
MAQIVLVEDDDSIRIALVRALRERGHTVTALGRGIEAITAIVDGAPDVVVLDLGLPDIDGADVLAMVRAVTQVPVVIATARDDERDVVRLLNLGADDYVVKPFGSAELLARIRAVLRRSAAPGGDAPALLQVGDLEMNLHTHSVTHDGRVLGLTLKEFALLRMLMEAAGRVVRRTDLIDEVWDPNWYGSTKTLDVHVSSLRKKLGDDPASPRYIHTVRGVGFRFSSPQELGAE